MILLTAAWRLFFPASALFAGLAVPLWLVLYGGDMQAMDDPLAWHMHEMLWGYLAAALAGFLLTAVPNWTGRPGIRGLALAALFGLWLAGRAAMFWAPEGAGPVISALFLPALGAWVARDIIAADNRRNLVVVGLIAAFWLAELCALWSDLDTGVNAGFAVAVMLMVLIGGRVTPAFSRNWLMRRGESRLPAPFGPIDRVAMTLTALMGAAWVLLGAGPLTGVLAAAAALALLARLSRWRAWAVKGEVLLLAQHAAYLWIVAGAALLALASLSDLASISQVRHAFGAGAVGTMTVIVMLRATLGHSGRELKGTWFDWLLFAILHAAAILRVVAGWAGDDMALVTPAGHMWATAMVMFVLRALVPAVTPRRQAG